MQTESPFATEFIPALGYKRGKYKVRPNVHAIMFHTTGYGVPARWERQYQKYHEDSPFETAIRVFSTGITGNNAAHYVIGQGRNECVQMVPEKYAAWGCGNAGSNPYFRPRWHNRWQGNRYAWWHRQYPNLDSPVDLASGKLWLGRSCNNNVIHVEVVCPHEGRKAKWSNDCWRTITGLTMDITGRHQIPRNAEHIITHSVGHPRSRTTRGGEPWDPWTTQWSWLRMGTRLVLFARTL